MTIIEFLRVRLEEDRLEWELHPLGDTLYGRDRRLAVALLSIRVEVLAGFLRLPGVVSWLPRRLLERIAERYADHPDYDPVWRLDTQT